MKKKIDPGLAYMQRLKIRPARDLARFSSGLAERIGKNAAETLRQLNTKRMSTGSGDDDLAFYEYKNSSFDISTVFSGMYEGDILRRACNWIQENLAYFGETILDVGCDNGIISCFLAASLPDCRILSIDRVSSAIAIAQQLADRLGLTNIEFTDGEVAALSPALQFDTVFSMRTIHENVDYSGYPTYASFNEKGEFFSEKMSTYVKSLAAHVKDTGTLVSIERGDRQELLLGWLYALNGAGVMSSPNHTKGITALELGDDCLLQAAVCFKTESRNHMQNVEVYNSWHAAATEKTNFNATEYHDWEAEVRFYDLAGTRLRQITYHDKDGKVAGRIGLWTCEGKENTLLVFNKLGNNSFLYFYDEDNLEALIDMLKTHKHNTTSRGFTADEV